MSTSTAPVIAQRVTIERIDRYILQTVRNSGSRRTKLMTTIRIYRPSKNTLARGVVLTLVLFIIVLFLNKLYADVNRFHCCQARGFYIDHEAPQYAFCTKYDVQSGDGKDCFVWYVMKYFLFAPLTAGFLISFVSTIFLKKSLRMHGILLGFLVAISLSLFLVWMRVTAILAQVVLR